jgi:NitT/TauT family transport system ATP-binding protein
LATLTTQQAAATSGAPPALELREVTCAFRGKGEAGYVAVSGASLSVADGEFVSLVGPTGCGKSTLLNAAAGLLAPETGSVLVFAAPLVGINQNAGYLFQADALMPWRNALANIALGLELRGVATAEARAQAAQWLQRVGLAGHAGKYPHELSGGMKKRVALAQTFILSPRILLMDEPFSALDVQTRELMENELLALWAADRKSVLFVTHDLEEAIALSDRVIVLSAGPASHPVGEFPIALPRPRDVAEIKHDAAFVSLHAEIWRTLKEQVLKAYALAPLAGT